MDKYTQRKIFISHSSKDKEYLRYLGKNSFAAEYCKVALEFLDDGIYYGLAEKCSEIVIVSLNYFLKSPFPTLQNIYDMIK